MVDKQSDDADWQYCFVGVDFDNEVLGVTYRNAPGLQSYQKPLTDPDASKFAHDVRTQLEREGWILDKQSGGGKGTYEYSYKRPSPR